MKTVFALIPLLVLATSLTARSQVYGFKDFRFPNQSGRGSSQLTTRVYYPATSTGSNVPIKPRADGHPVIVVLHGFSLMGSDYSLLGRHFAGKGYVVALLNTSRFSGATQTLDAMALIPALKAANASGFLQGALNLKKVGLAGHSMGGNSTFTVLANNPGYRCGLGLAPINASSVVSKVGVAIGIVHGKGDWVLGWRLNGLSTYNAARNYADLKFLYLMTLQCGHNNVAGLFLLTRQDREVWDRSARVMGGFFDKFLEGNPAGMEEVAGLSAQSSSVLDTLHVESKTPSMWITGTPEIGKIIAPTLLSETGTVVLAVALSTARIPISFGLLRLDPATLTVLKQGATGANQLFTAQFRIPNDPGLRGRIFPLQGLGQNNIQNPRLSNLVSLAVR